MLAKLDEALSHYVYKKIWKELSFKDQWNMSFVVKKENMTTVEFLGLLESEEK